MKALIIPVGEAPRVADLDFPGIQAACGGDVTHIDTPAEWREQLGLKVGVDGWLNEEGKQTQPFNPEATKMFADALFWGDYICGTLVLAGERGGSIVDVPDALVQAVLRRYEALQFPGQLGADGIGMTFIPLDDDGITR